MDNTDTILDLDTLKSITELGVNIPTNEIHRIDQLTRIIESVGVFSGRIHRDTGTYSQFKINIKYLNLILSIIFEFDASRQFINIIYYNNDQTNILLKLLLSINDDPTIKYVESDKSAINHSVLKPGAYLINFAHCFFSFIGSTRSRLDDDSHLVRKLVGVGVGVGVDIGIGVEIRIKLWLYHLITKGKSWYAKFGYEPTNSTDFELFIGDVQQIRLDKVIECLKKVIHSNKILDPILTKVSNTIIEIVGDSTETLLEYTNNRTITDFALLTNNLTQSIYGKKTFETSDEETIQLDFFWFDLCRNLFVLNVMQINNNIENHFLR